MKIALGDGSGSLGLPEFWKSFFNSLEIEFIDVDEDIFSLKEVYESFPKNICLNSKQRLKRAIELSKKKVDIVIYYLRDDEVVHNCPASIYRLKWLADYYKNKHTRMIIVKKKETLSDSDYTLLHTIAKNIGKENEFITLNLDKDIVIPKRKKIYKFATKYNKKNILLVGVAPHVIDPYRTSDIMDFLHARYNLYEPRNFTEGMKLEKRNIDELSFFKVDAIKEALNKIYEQDMEIEHVIFAADALDIPGKYSFPILKNYIEQCNQKFEKKIQFIDVTPNLSNQEKIIDRIMEFVG